MPDPIRIVHYLNQVYAGIGRDEKADLPLEVRERPVGPARLLNYLLGERADVVATIVCGDGYFANHKEEALAAFRDELARSGADVAVAGPAFDIASYGLACAVVCGAAQEMGVPSVTAMTPGNPGAGRRPVLFRVVPTGPAPGDMMETVSRLGRAALELGGGTGPAV